MHRLLCSALLLFLLCCAYGCAAAAVVQPLPQKGQSVMDAFTVAVAKPKKQPQQTKRPQQTKQPLPWRPIRIRVFTEGVYIWITECSKLHISAWGRVIPAFCYGDALITPEKAKIINDVVVEAAQLHMDRLRVRRGNRKGSVIPLNRRNGNDLKKNCPSAFARIAHHEVGLKDGDFALYVSPSVSHEHARICTEATDGRPTSALIRVNSATIKHTRYYVRLAAHDIGHGLGFMIPVFMDYNLVDQRNDPTGRLIAFMNSSVVLDKAKEHFGCTSVNGLEFQVRDEAIFGYKWVAYPHWRRRFAKDDLMSPYLEKPSGMYYTVLTLAAFDSLPFYQADFSKAETMSWGRKKGCDFVQRNCVENETFINPDMYCTEISTKMRCTTDRRSLGKCSMERLWSILVPSYFDYFPQNPRGSPYEDGMDFCPVIEPTFDTSCELGKEDKMPGSLVSNTSVCLDAKSVVLSKGGKSEVEGICAKVKCQDGILKVQYKGNDDWHNCKDGNFIDNLNGKVFASGKIVCPNYADICGPKPIPKPTSRPNPGNTLPTTAVRSSPATGTSVGSTNEGTSTASHVQTDTRVNEKETHEKQPVQTGHEAEKPQDGSQVSETPVTEENPAHTDSQTTGAGSHEEHQVQEEHQVPEEHEEHLDNGNVEHLDNGNVEHLDNGNVEHLDSGYEDAVGTNPEDTVGAKSENTVGTNPGDFNAEEYMKGDGKSVLEAMLNNTVNPQSRRDASNDQRGSNGQQGVFNVSNGAGRKRRSAPDAHGAAGRPSERTNTTGMAANGQNTGENAIRFSEYDMGHVLSQVEVIHNKGLDSSIAASSIFSLAVLVCVAAALAAA